MLVKLVQIGNSMGIRLPKNLIRQFGLDKGPIELIVKKEGIMIKPALTSEVPPREEWDRLFKEALAAGDDPKNDDEEFDDFYDETDENEWTWPEL